MKYPTLHDASMNASRKLPATWLTATHVAALTMGLLGVVGCATQSTDGNVGGNDPTGTTSATTTTATGMMTGSTGSGVTTSSSTGTGGMSPCAMDCSSINTPPCLKSVCNDGSYQGPIGSCVVVPDEGATCDDGKFCTTDDKCDADAKCVGGPTNDCGMTAGECKAIQCNEAAQNCTEVGAFDPNQTCTDGAECTSGSCSAGKCDPPSCVAPDLCTVNAVCNAAGQCVGTPKDCSFSPLTECNAVACNPANGKCEGAPDTTKNGTACQLTGDLCHTGKTCLAGQCQGGTAKDCSAFNQECALGVCNAANGACQSQPIPAGGMCSAATDDCNQGYCNATGLCVPMPLMDGTACSDNDLCTTGDSCAAGVCGGTALPGCGAAIFSDSFETCPGGWTFAGEWQCGVATTSIAGAHPPTAPQDGAKVIGTNLTGEYLDDDLYSATTATSPVINLTGTTNPTLSFYIWIDTEGASTVYDGANLRISQDGGPFQLVGAGPTCTPANSCTTINISKPYHTALVEGEPAWGGQQHTQGWQLVTVDLTGYVGHQIQARFSFGSDFTGTYSGVYVDQVKVQEAQGVQLGITTPSLPKGVADYAYSAALSRSGGSPGAVWSIKSGGTNASWLTINPSTGVLTGTPSAANLGLVSVTIHVEEPTLPSNFDEQTYTFNIESATAIPYTEGFEGTCPNGWTLTGDWQCGTPSVVGPATAFAGTQCLATVINGNYNNNDAYATTTATSPVYGLSGSSPKVSWKAWVKTETGAYDAYNILVSTDGGSTWTQLTSVTPAYTGTVNSQQAWYGQSSMWVDYQASLAAYAGKAVMIRFAFRSDFTAVNPGVYIDEVAVTPN